MKDVHVIVLNWKGWKDTLACIDSLKALPNPPEIVVVDNASGDESVPRIRAAHPEVQLIEASSNLGFAGGNNLGIRHALEQGAKYIWLLNNDTQVLPDTLSELLKASAAQQDHGLVASLLRYYDPPHDLQTYGGGKVNLWLGRTRFMTRPHETPDYLVFASVLIPARVLKACGFLNEDFFLYWEDVDYSFTVKKAGFRLSTAPASVVLHKESASLGKRNPLLESYTSESLVKFFKRHSVVPLVPILCALGTKTLSRVAKGNWEGVQAVWRPVLNPHWRKR